jgi:hypothetical protein
VSAYKFPLYATCAVRSDEGVESACCCLLLRQLWSAGSVVACSFLQLLRASKATAMCSVWFEKGGTCSSVHHQAPVQSFCHKSSQACIKCPGSFLTKTCEAVTVHRCMLFSEDACLNAAH